MYGRQAYVGLSGGFGTAVGGRLYTPYYTFMLQMDPFANGTVGAYSNAWRVGAATPTASALTGLLDPQRVDNAAAYISPSFGGFTVTGAFSNNATGQENASSNAGNNTVYAILGKYDNGPLTVGVNYHYIAAGSNLGLDNVQNATLGGSFDFKVAKVMALYSWNELDFQAINSKTVTVNNYMLGVTDPFGKFTGKASYIYSDGNTTAGGDAQQFALGLDYNLSKRTALYSAYSFIDNQDNRLSAVGDASNSGAFGATNGVSLPGVFQQGVQVGVRHMF
mgnify:CR=1 FL=1